MSRKAKARRRTLPEETEERVKIFNRSADVSRIMVGKKDFVSHGENTNKREHPEI